MTQPFSFPPSTVWGDFAFYLIERGNTRLEWKNDLRSAEGHVASSDIDILQYDGFTDWTLTAEAWFCSRDEWMQFAALRGTTAPLRHYATLTAHAPRSQVVPYPNGDYVVFANATLHAAGNATPHRAYPDVMTATITFRVCYDGTRYSTYGYAHYEPEGEG